LPEIIDRPEGGWKEGRKEGREEGRKKTWSDLGHLGIYVVSTRYVSRYRLGTCTYYEMYVKLS
jgi:hypothetical protein